MVILVATRHNHNSDGNHPDIDIGQKEGEEKNVTVASHVKVDVVEVGVEVVIVNGGKFFSALLALHLTIFNNFSSQSRSRDDDRDRGRSASRSSRHRHR